MYIVVICCEEQRKVNQTAALKSRRLPSDAGRSTAYKSPGKFISVAVPPDGKCVVHCAVAALYPEGPAAWAQLAAEKKNELVGIALSTIKGAISDPACAERALTWHMCEEDMFDLVAEGLNVQIHIHMTLEDKACFQFGMKPGRTQVHLLQVPGIDGAGNGHEHFDLMVKKGYATIRRRGNAPVTQRGSAPVLIFVIRVAEVCVFSNASI